MAKATSCEVGRTWCLNSVEHAGELRQKCTFCRLAPGNVGLSGQYWKGTTAKMQHPVLREEKRNAAQVRTQTARHARLARDPGKRRVLRKAVRAETRTEHVIIQATRNSGRANRDGDHVVGGQITLDTKLQSTRDNPVVLLTELAKVREDARRAGTPIGGLVLRNKYDVGVVVFLEQDFARTLLSRL
jgi:K+/H+ antiporter YhaU regulatory subunit KhtT